MRELLPDFEKEAPLDAAVTKEAVYFLTPTGKFKFPITPPPMRDHGNYVISINKFVKWLGSKVEEAGNHGLHRIRRLGTAVRIRTRLSACAPTTRASIRTNQQKSNFEPGYDLKSKVVILAEGTRGSLTKQLIGRFQLDRERNPQTYGVGVKELWELPAGRMAAGEVIYTMGYPLTFNEYGGAWIYGSKDNIVSLGFVTGLDYPDPRIDPQHVLQEFKKHPSSPSCWKAARWCATARSRCRTAAGGAFRRWPAMAG